MGEGGEVPQDELHRVVGIPSRACVRVLHYCIVLPRSRQARHHSFTDPARARTVFREVAGKHIDWPEMLWEQWRTFEHAHGSVDDFEEAIARITILNDKLTARRAQVTSARSASDPLLTL